MLVQNQIVLAADRLSKRFGGNIVVDQVSIAFAKGRLHSILGPNGAGKTTLFNLLTRDLTPDSGAIRLGATDITDLTPDRVARMGVARSYQISSVYLDMSARENVWVAAYRARGGNSFVFWRQVTRFAETREWAFSCLERLGLVEIADVPVRELSYGDQRLLELAVTLACEPRIILLDEPTAGLSSKEAERVKRVIMALKGEFSIIMIEHNVGIVMDLSDEITVMNRGAVIAHGSPFEIRENRDVQEAYFGG
ncbi:ABC transporter ATP-binding protein [Bradyrhizobium neotropicale]|uniref:ABC transporter ATP-binding protein n=1 Tax=Bradyrhizobium neotropicale TaxID=1497615 RepID=UPI001AD672CE|nr:ABC transporter ATP-binding protein [Bradyrhizobium neotropicale]MBO4223874.1 ATP-binding cassette domain-containing protein [Bradyrhizobium neotropicale]